MVVGWPRLATSHRCAGTSVQFVVSHVIAMCMSYAILESTVRDGFGASCLVVGLCVCWLCVPWGGETGSPPLKSSGFFFMCRGFFGGRGIARPSSSSHPRCVHQQCGCVLRRRKDWHFSLPPHNAEEFSGGGGIGPPPHKSGEYIGGGGTGPLPHNVGTFNDYLLVVQCRLFVDKIGLGC